MLYLVEQEFIKNVAAKALADQISDLAPRTRSAFGRLLGRIEEGKGEAYATKIDVRCSDRNKVIAEKRILIATGGSATAEMAMKYSSFSLWLSKVWLAFMDESQQYGNAKFRGSGGVFLKKNLFFFGI